MAIEYINIVTGIVGGIAYSLTGWAKHAKKDKEEFDWSRFGYATCIGAVYGIISAFTMQDISLVANGTIAVAVTGLFQNIWKAIFG